MDEITKFVKSLSTEIVNVDVDNFYSGRSNASKLKRRNLELYLRTMHAIKPRVLLVAEAPGFNGAKNTGVPFSCEKLLADNAHPIFGLDRGFELLPPEDLASEVSANIVWNEIRKYENIPLIWNIFPFHPFKEGNSNSNRTPRVSEINQGKNFIYQLIRLFEIDKIGAVGRKAESGLDQMKLDQSIVYIRHPSYGGKSDFVKGMEIILK